MIGLLNVAKDPGACLQIKIMMSQPVSVRMDDLIKILCNQVLIVTEKAGIT